MGLISRVSSRTYKYDLNTINFTMADVEQINTDQQPNGSFQIKIEQSCDQLPEVQQNAFFQVQTDQVQGNQVEYQQNQEYIASLAESFSHLKTSQINTNQINTN